MSLDEEDILVVDGGDTLVGVKQHLISGHLKAKIGGVMPMGPGNKWAQDRPMGQLLDAKPTCGGCNYWRRSPWPSPGLTPLETAIDREIPITVVVSNNANGE